MSWMLLLSIALLSEVPIKPDGRKLPVGTACWRSTIETDRRRSEVTVEVLNGQEVLRIVERRTGAGTDRRDELVARRDDMRPITFRRSDHGRPTMDLEYSKSWIIGWQEIDGQRSAVTTRPDRIVWDGNMLSPLVTALPQGSHRVPVYRDNRILMVDVGIKARSPVAAPAATATAPSFPQIRTDVLGGAGWVPERCPTPMPR